MHIVRRTVRRVAAAGALAALVLPLESCDNVRKELLAVVEPDVINPASTNSAEAADFLRVGALSRARGIMSGGEGWVLYGLLADEWKSSNTFFQHNDTDQRNNPDDNSVVAGVFTGIHRVRNSSREAINALNTYKPTPAWGIGQMWWTMGYAELSLAENFCNGVPLGDASTGQPVYGPPLTNAEILAIAITHFDSALAMATATDANSVGLKNLATIHKARALVDLGQFSAAAALVAPIATNYGNTVFTFTLTAGDGVRDVFIWNYNNSVKRMTVSDSYDITGVIKNALPFASAQDPRVKTVGSSTGTSARGRGFDGSTNLVTQEIWGRLDPPYIVSGLDARLIEAEAKLQANDFAGTTAMLNALRAAPQVLGPAFTTPVMAALPVPATKDAAIDQFFREKAFWQFSRGYRLNDLRRLVRQYGRLQENVFPSGTYFKGDTYGSDVNFPVTPNELNNPQFTGCLDRKA